MSNQLIFVVRISWSSKLIQTHKLDFLITNQVDINLKPQFLIESGYYFVPSPSITLINTYNALSKIISPNFIYWWTAVPTTCGFCWKQANDMLFEHFGTTSEKLILIRLPRKKVTFKKKRKLFIRQNIPDKNKHATCSYLLNKVEWKMNAFVMLLWKG